jgi:2-polyprenyl-3-methyl-5-hydroxy-6-metoxy-1,4-benzoquinol methylase
VEALLGEITGQRLCDVACGQGRVARRLAELGAAVVAVDSSARLLEIARRHEATHPRGIEYRQGDARRLDGFADGVFDGAVCFMALMGIPDLAPTLGGIARILRPGGWFVFAVLHPCYHTARSGELVTPEGVVRTVGAYFAEGHWRSATRPGPPGKVGAYHRTLSTYVNALLDAGFVLERLGEPRATGVAAERRPVWAEVPAVLVGRCTRIAPG